MTRDYKHQARSRRKGGAPGWAWLLAGLGIGLFVALLVYLEMRAPGSTTRGPAHTVPGPQAPRDTGKTGAKTAPSEPRFDFYTILPEMEVVTPEHELGADAARSVPPVKQPGTYVLQAGSFRRFAEADRLKASLALLGIEADIQTVTINGGETWHRVRIGPFRDLAELNEVRARLKENNIKTILLRIRG